MRKENTELNKKYLNGIRRITLRNKIKGIHIKATGGLKSLSSQQEDEILKQIFVCAQCVMPLISMDIRQLVKGYLSRTGRMVQILP